MPKFLSVTEIYRLLQRELPEDVYADGAPDLYNTAADMCAAASGFHTAYGNLERIYENYFPQYADEKIGDWEVMVFGQLSEGSLTLQERRDRVIAKLRERNRINLWSILVDILNLLPSQNGRQFASFYDGAPTYGSAINFGVAFNPDLRDPFVLSFSAYLDADGDFWFRTNDQDPLGGFGLSMEGYQVSANFFLTSTTLNKYISVSFPRPANSAWHDFEVRWDGSLLASGLTFLIDGVAAAVSVHHDGLDGTYLTSQTNELHLSGSPAFYVREFEISVDETVTHRWPLKANARDQVGSADGVATLVRYLMDELLDTGPDVQLFCWYRTFDDGGWTLDVSRLNVDTYLGSGDVDNTRDTDPPEGDYCDLPDTDFWQEQRTRAYGYEVRIFDYTLSDEQYASLDKLISAREPARSKHWILDGLDPDDYGLIYTVSPVDASTLLDNAYKDPLSETGYSGRSASA